MTTSGEWRLATVLADGAVVNASEEEENPDLFMALKGGGYSFGAVTKFTLNADDQEGLIWGGRYILEARRIQNSKVAHGCRKLTTEYPDEEAAIIPVPSAEGWVLFVYYRGARPPADVFERSTELGPKENLPNTWQF
ncbi:uncharacterized protein BDW43DRAFT_313101 [Aspergillus alliaceus]|uniref:uncharacterized protein n=1 Tax=Petromyces alliaceus TaxID=209559 RepID=UPI0012A43C15|nr:uncharacterized protein BDW43DRAFT_313101 [Aspergillus alliaceus]KAB8231289.1 hypothetical protein BDW43DRAFT_313101 [Aspergillus alliaceus]